MQILSQMNPFQTALSAAGALFLHTISILVTELEWRPTGCLLKCAEGHIHTSMTHISLCYESWYHWWSLLFCCYCAVLSFAIKKFLQKAAWCKSPFLLHAVSELISYAPGDTLVQGIKMYNFITVQKWCCKKKKCEYWDNEWEKVSRKCEYWDNERERGLFFSLPQKQILSPAQGKSLLTKWH